MEDLSALVIKAQTLLSAPSAIVISLGSRPQENQGPWPL
jgi:hypothetical protein